MALGDGSASLVGRHVDSPRWTLINQTKSLAGTTAMLISTIGVIGCMQQIFGLNISLSYILMIGIIITALEQLSFYGIDNLSVPISAAFLINAMT